MNRLTQKSYPDTTTVNYTYDLDSRLTQVTDPTGTYQFTFDNATLARCRECEKEKPEPKDVPVFVPEWKKWLERNRTPLLITGAVVAGAAAIALAPATGGASLLVFAAP